MATGVDPTATQMNHFLSYVKMLVDPNRQDVSKLIAMREISENFEMILSSTLYPTFLDHSIKIFLKILQEGEPHFIAEYNIHQVRKLILEILHRFPTNNLLRSYVKPMLSLMLKLLKIENEENVLVCLKIIIELHKQYRPPFNEEIQDFLQFVKSIYSDLPNHMNKIFEPKAPIKVGDLSELNLDELLNETFTTTTIQVEKKNKDDVVTITDVSVKARSTRNNLGSFQYNLIPKAVLSLKVLQELPIIVVLMYQLNKQSVHQDVSDFIPLIMTTITLQPSQLQRESDKFNKEIFVDFMGAQIKTLSFLAYIIKYYQEVVSNHSAMMVQGMLELLALCPMEVAHLRRELLIAARHILATDLRNSKFHFRCSFLLKTFFSRVRSSLETSLRRGRAFGSRLDDARVAATIGLFDARRSGAPRQAPAAALRFRSCRPPLQQERPRRHIGDHNSNDVLQIAFESCRLHSDPFGSAE